MTPDEFRAAGHELIDWIADYRAGLESRPVKAQVKPGEVAGAMPASPPTGRSTIGELLADLDSIVVPGMTLVQHPMNFALGSKKPSAGGVMADGVPAPPETAPRGAVPWHRG